MIPLPERLGLRLLHLAEVDSTNRVCADAGRSGQPAGLVVLADGQTAGRGRQGRSWHAPASSGLTVSLLRRPRVKASLAPLWTLIAGLAVQRTAAPWGEAWLKWPNDVWVGDRKLAGVLCELQTIGMSVDHLVVGVGLNLRPPADGWPDFGASRATSLQEQDPERPVVIEQILLMLLENIVDLEFELEASGPLALMSRARRAMAPLFGRTVQIDRGQGLEQVEVLGISAGGALRVRAGGKEHELLAGDVHLSAVAD